METKYTMGRRKFFGLGGVVAAGAAMLKSLHADAEPAASAAPGLAFKEAQRIPVDVDNPSALALDAKGALYVAGENAIVKLDAGGKESARFDVKGRPGCIAATPEGTLLAGIRNRIHVIDAKGATVATWDDLGERAYLTSIVADESNVYAADAGNRIVLRFDHKGVALGRIGKRDHERNIPGLVVPSPYFDVALDPMGELWVVNPGKHGLENYRSNGDLVSSWYRSGMDVASFCGCCNPIHIAFRSNSSVVTAEKGLSRVKVYGPDTTLLGVVLAPEHPEPLSDEAMFCNVEPPIMDIAVDAKDRILVLDKSQKAVLVFEEVA